MDHNQVWYSRFDVMEEKLKSWWLGFAIGSGLMFSILAGLGYLID